MMFSNDFTCLREVTADLISVFICGATVQGKVGVFTVSQINGQFSLHLQQLTVPTPSGSRAFQLPVIFRDTFLLIIGGSLEQRLSFMKCKLEKSLGKLLLL